MDRLKTGDVNLAPSQGTVADLPDRAHNRNARVRYPWDELAPGGWFEFSGDVTLANARSMASQRGQTFAMSFRVFRGTDNRVYCQRVDGIPAEQQRTSSARKIMPAREGVIEDLPTERPSEDEDVI